MKNENKCFFSISLENGIIITGQNRDEVKHFISDLSCCVGDAIKSGINDKYLNYKSHLNELVNQLDAAWMTIIEMQKQSLKCKRESHDIQSQNME